jgi:hypothetical protein
MELDRKELEELMTYLERVMTSERPLCWWCARRPARAGLDCKVYEDWRDVVAMVRKTCRSFRADLERLKIAPQRKPEPDPYRAQLEIDFPADRGAKS